MCVCVGGGNACPPFRINFVLLCHKLTHSQKLNLGASFFVHLFVYGGCIFLKLLQLLTL